MKLCDQTAIMAAVTAPTAGILLVGNELLYGKVRDENAYYLARELSALGISLRRVVVVPDEMDQVIEAFRDLLERVDVVVTSGGIGPTHDDITVEAISRALDRPLELIPDLEARAHTIFGCELGPAHLKMARVPRGCELIESERLRWPVIAMDQVYVLAGVPQILRRGFDAIRQRLPTGTIHQVASIYVSTDEWTLAPLLDATVAAYPRVEIGSYPVMGNPGYRIRVTLEATEAEQVRQAVQDLLGRIPTDQVLRVVPREDAVSILNE
jgi:molybdenum cofactor synthesis domain-containing protein